jgi:hypothetical protein
VFLLPCYQAFALLNGTVDESFDYEDRDWRDMVAPRIGELVRGGINMLMDITVGKKTLG